MKDEKIFKEGFMDKHPFIPNMSIYNTINFMNLSNKKGFAVDSLDLRVTYEQMFNDAIMLSKAFKELGIKSNDIITISMPSYYQGIAIFLAANRIGATVSFLNYGCEIEEIKKYLNLFESPLFIDFEKTQEYNESIKRDTKVKQIITISCNDINNIFYNKNNKLIGYNDFISYSDMELISNYYKKIFNTFYFGKHEALILFTSGSTGQPKSVLLTNENVISSGIYMKNTGHIKAIKGEKCLICVPFNYPYGFCTSTLMSLMCGREAILASEMRKDNVEYYMSKNPNYIFGSPAIKDLIIKGTPEGQDLSSCHSFISGGDFLMPNQAIEAIKFFNEHGSNIEIFNGSGNAETAGASSIAVGSPIKRESVGRILVGSNYIIVDPNTFEILPTGKEGMLCISGKHVFKEYYKDKKATSESKFIYNGKEYYKTGAIGYSDENDYFYMTGRASRFYIRFDSHKVYPENIQRILCYIDCIKDCAAVKKANDQLRFETYVYIVLKDGYEKNYETKEHIKSELLRIVKDKQFNFKEYEIPFTESIEFIDEIPKTEADKIDYNLLESMAEKCQSKKLEKKLNL